MSNPPTERPWPPPPGHDPSQEQEQDQFHELSVVPAEPADRLADEHDGDAFPLWPTSGTAPAGGEHDGEVEADGEELHGVVVDDAVQPPAYLGTVGPGRVRSDEFATVVLEAVAPNRVPLASTPMPAGPYVSPGRELVAAHDDQPAEVDRTRVTRELVAVPAEVNPFYEGRTTVSDGMTAAGVPTTTSDGLTMVAECWGGPAGQSMDAVAPVPAPVWPVNPVPEQGSSGSPATPVQGKKRKEAPEQWPPPELRATTQARASTARVLAPRVAVRAKPIRHLRRPGPGLAWMLLFALLATFFAYTAAEPTWLALGHATRGTATVVRCADAGVFRRCDADFVSGRFEATGVALVGADHVPGTATRAEMVGPRGRIAYAGSQQSLLVRGLIGLALVLLCGLGISWVTGAGRLSTRRNRAVVRLLSVALPLLIGMGVLAATW